MYSVIFPEWQDEEVILPDPDSEMPESEKERLFEELCKQFMAGAFDPELEILI